MKNCTFKFDIQKCLSGTCSPRDGVHRSRVTLRTSKFSAADRLLSLKTAPIIPGEGEVRPHSIGTRMMTNYLNPSMYLFWFTVGAPFLVRSSRTDFWPGIVFTLSFYVSIIGAKSLVALGISRSSRLTEGIWYPRIMKLLGIFLMGFSLVFVKDGLGYFGLI